MAKKIHMTTKTQDAKTINLNIVKKPFSACRNANFTAELQKSQTVAIDSYCP